MGYRLQKTEYKIRDSDRSLRSEKSTYFQNWQYKCTDDYLHKIKQPYFGLEYFGHSFHP